MVTKTLSKAQSKPLLSKIAKQLNEPELRVLEQVQSLWKGYGDILRVWLPRQQRPIIIKRVCPPKITSFSSEDERHSHQRKLKSFVVELNVYEGLVNRCLEHCFAPQCLATASIPAIEQPEDLAIAMEDLNHLGFSGRGESDNLHQVRLALQWLANFHAEFFAETHDGIGAKGTYWYLDTRQSEWQDMSPAELKEQAPVISKTLHAAHFKTVIHGDSKLANFCFHDQDNKVAAVDFQYCGYGVGVTDVMLLLSSALTENTLLELGDALLDEFFVLFKEALGTRKPELQSAFPEIEKEWRNLWPLTWADYHRFLEGWKPGHVRVNQFMLTKTAEALVRL